MSVRPSDLYLSVSKATRPKEIKKALKNKEREGIEAATLYLYMYTYIDSSLEFPNREFSILRFNPFLEGKHGILGTNNKTGTRLFLNYCKLMFSFTIII